MDDYIDGFSYTLEMFDTEMDGVEESERKSKQKIEKLKEKIKKEGFKHFRHERSVLTEDSKEVSLENGVIRIKPNKECVAITIRGRKQKTNEYNPHKICLYIEDINGELLVDKKHEANSDRVHISVDKGYVEPERKSGILLGTYDFQTIVRGFYQDFKFTTFYAGVAIVAGNDDTSLVITSFRGKEFIEIKKFKLQLECDRWYRRDEVK